MSHRRVVVTTLLRCARALYGVLLSPELAANKATPMFLSLLYKAVRADPAARRAAAFAKRLLQAALHAPPAFACGALMLVSQLLQARPRNPDLSNLVFLLSHD